MSVTLPQRTNEEWSSQLWSQFLQLRKEAWKKFRTSTGLEPVTSRYRCDALPTELWSHWRWEQVNFGFMCYRERYEVNDACEINHMWTADMKSNEEWSSQSRDWNQRISAKLRLVLTVLLLSFHKLLTKTHNWFELKTLYFNPDWLLQNCVLFYLNHMSKSRCYLNSQLCWRERE